MNPKILFITTKNIDYIRNTQEIQLLKENGYALTLLYSCRSSYPLRLAEIYLRLLFFSMKEYDKVFIGFSPQLILPFWAWKFRKQTVIIDFFISVYDTFVNDRKKVKARSRLGRFLHWLDDFTFQRTDHVIADTKADAAYFIQEFSDDLEKGRQKTKVLYLAADLNLYYPRKKSKPSKLAGRFIVLYFGSVLPLQGVDIILKALESLKDQKELYFFIIGPLGNAKIQVASENIEYIDWLKQEELAEYISYADLCLAGHFNREIDKAKRTIPGKTYIYRAMKKPVILGDNPANRELFDEKMNDIYFVPMGDSEALAEKILEISHER